MLRLSGPRIWAVAVYHINLFVDTLLASFSNIVGEGAIAAIHYSNRLGFVQSGHIPGHTSGFVHFTLGEEL